MNEAITFLYLPTEGHPSEHTEPLPYGELVRQVGSPVQVIPLTNTATMYVCEDGGRQGWPINHAATHLALQHNRIRDDETLHGVALVIGPMLQRGQASSLSDDERSSLLAMLSAEAH